MVLSETFWPLARTAAKQGRRPSLPFQLSSVNSWVTGFRPIKLLTTHCDQSVVIPLVSMIVRPWLLCRYRFSLVAPNSPTFSATPMPVRRTLARRVRGLPEEGSTSACGCASSPMYWKKTASLSLTRPMPIIISTSPEDPPVNSAISALWFWTIAVSFVIVVSYV